MADKETEQKWQKSRQIEAEKEKARLAANGQKSDEAVNLAYLGVQQKKIAGWSVDRNLLLRKTEKMGTWSAMLVPVGILMEIIGQAGAIVVQINNLGLAGVMIAGIPSAIGAAALGMGTVFTVLVIAVELYLKIRDRREFGMGWWSAMGAVVMLVIYILLRRLVLRFI